MVTRQTVFRREVAIGGTVFGWHEDTVVVAPDWAEAAERTVADLVHGALRAVPQHVPPTVGVPIGTAWRAGR